MIFDLSFFQNKRILITGHTGFKGSWLSQILLMANAKVTGYSLHPPTEPNLFSIINLENRITSIIGDVRNLSHLEKVFEIEQPEIVFHLAAQPIVRESYNNPVYTYETNVLGTVNVLECIRMNKTVKSFVNVTTDKVYKNEEWEWGYREIDPLDGNDPYSNSKSCSELVTHSYKNSFFNKRDIGISTARAGNVIGGGDFALDRIIPDCIRAVIKQEKIIVRNPHSIRPYQHVLEPLFGYLLIAKKQYMDAEFAGWYNIGPNENDCVTTASLVNHFCKIWGKDASWENVSDGGPHEANFLKLDCSKMKSSFGWYPKWNIEKAIQMTIEWTKVWLKGDDVNMEMNRQIENYLG